MPSSASTRELMVRHAHISLCIAIGIALGAPASALAATTWTVNTCGNDNTGSGTTGTLRYAAANATSGDTIDMTGLTCSTISLSTGAITGAITFPQDTLTVNGPGIGSLSISGEYNGVVEADRIINHTGTGFLNISGVSLRSGSLTNATGYALGGCLYSAGYVVATGIGVYMCNTSTTSGFAGGGGIFAGALYLKNSTLDHNVAYGGTSGGAGGGGALTHNFTAKYSTISNNEARGASGNAAGFGGGLKLFGSVTITASTISGNFAGRDIGGVDAFTYTPLYLTTTITNSTISHNQATNYIGGIYLTAGVVQIKNSTIVFNTAGKDRTGTFPPHYYLAPGLATSGSYGPQAVFLQSSLIANNTIGTGVEYDLSEPIRGSTAVTFSGSNNLVRVTSAAVPGDTIKNSCPLLGPLRNNGGLTQTHALLSHSPGIDQGSNLDSVNQDQRGTYVENVGGGPYLYPRVSGAAADIGAYEVQQDDIVFNTSFEGCP